MISITKIELPVTGMELLRAEARTENYDFIETLFEHWVDGTNRFSAPGEILCGCFEEDVLVAVGGLTIDRFVPSVGKPDTARLRRVYVRPAWRNKGIGRALVETLITEARKTFTCVRLRAESDQAARLYEKLGFIPIFNPDASHILFFDGNTPPSQLSLTDSQR